MSSEGWNGITRTIVRIEARVTGSPGPEQALQIAVTAATPGRARVGGKTLPVVYVVCRRWRSYQLSSLSQ
jgi:hypothetical protein